MRHAHPAPSNLLAEPIFMKPCGGRGGVRRGPGGPTYFAWAATGGHGEEVLWRVVEAMRGGCDVPPWFTASSLILIPKGSEAQDGKALPVLAATRPLGPSSSAMATASLSLRRWTASSPRWPPRVARIRYEGLCEDGLSMKTS